jgi:hypothetical protein
VLAVLLPTPLFSQQTASLSSQIADTHYGEPVDLLLASYPRAHGYQHGYEDGFHFGEWDRQMGEPRRAPEHLHEYKRARRGYMAAMGPLRLFQTGYREGFKEGYADAYSGRAFQGENGLARFGGMLAAVISHQQHPQSAAAQPASAAPTKSKPEYTTAQVSTEPHPVVLDWPGNFLWQSTENIFGTDLPMVSSPASQAGP